MSNNLLKGKMRNYLRCTERPVYRLESSRARRGRRCNYYIIKILRWLSVWGEVNALAEKPKTVR